jgi:hypothetical protein
MTRNGKLIFAGVTAAALGLAAAGAVAYHRGGDWGHHGRGFGFRHQGGPMGFMGFGGFHALGRFCRGNSAEMADHMLVRIEHRVKPTEAQKEAFDEFKAAARDAAEKMRAGCPKEAAGDAGEDGAKPVLTPIDRLDRAKVQLEASLEALKTLRPAAEKFYAVLADEQKARLNERPRHWKRGERGERGGRGGGESEGANPDAPAPKQD